MGKSAPEVPQLSELEPARVNGSGGETSRVESIIDTGTKCNLGFNSIRKRSGPWAIFQRHNAAEKQSKPIGIPVSSRSKI